MEKWQGLSYHQGLEGGGGRVVADFMEEVADIRGKFLTVIEREGWGRNRWLTDKKACVRRRDRALEADRSAHCRYQRGEKTYTGTEMREKKVGAFGGAFGKSSESDAGGVESRFDVA